MAHPPFSPAFLPTLLLFCILLVSTDSIWSQVEAHGDTILLKQQLTEATNNRQKTEVLEKLINVYWETDKARTEEYLIQLMPLVDPEINPRLAGFAAMKEAAYFYFASELGDARGAYRKAYDNYLLADSTELAWLAYIRIGVMHSLEGDQASAEANYREVVTAIENEDYPRAMAFLHNQFGTLFHYQNEPDSASKYYSLAVSEYGQLKDTVGMLRPMFNQGVLWNEQGKEDSYERFVEIADIHRSRGSYTSLLTTLTALSSVEGISHQNFEESQKYAEEAYVLSKEQMNVHATINALKSLSRVSAFQYDYEQVRLYLEEAESLARDNGLKEALIMVLYNKATNFAEMEAYPKALEAIQEGRAISAEIGGSRMDSRLLDVLLFVYYNTQEYEAMEEVLVEHLAEAKKNQSVLDESRNYVFSAQMYIATNRWDKAAEYVRLAAKLGKTTNIETRQELVDLQAKISEYEGDYRSALSYYQAYQALSDSLNNNNNIRRLTSAQKDFEFDREKDRLLVEQGKKEAALLAQSKLSRIIAMSIGLFAVLLGGFFYSSRRQNAKIAEQNQLLDQLNRTKDRIFAIIGHDLRKPAIAFRGITQKINYLLAKEDYPRLSALGKSMEQDAQSLGQLTDNLLSWALLQKNIISYQPEPVSLLSIAEEVQMTFQRSLTDKKIKWNTAVAETDMAYADRSALRTIIRNLVDNAVKYTPVGGTIQLSAQTEKGQLKISLRDTGVGMDEQQLEKLFSIQSEKSQVGTAGESGTGLGLHLVKELVELNKGTVEVVSSIGEGTTFIVGFPKSISS